VRDKWEEENFGGFEKVYPCAKMDNYLEFLAEADNIWASWTGVKRKPPKELSPPPVVTKPRRIIFKKTISGTIKTREPFLKSSNSSTYILPDVFARLSTRKTTLNSPKAIDDHLHGRFEYNPIVHYDITNY
jgi:hypothetical protein